MRSPREIRYRLRQEIANATLCVFPPKLAAITPAPLDGLPDPAAIARALKGSRHEAQLIQAAEEIMAGRYRILGLDLALGTNLHWRRDPVHHRETPPRYFRAIPYLDFNRAGDHKIIWELNRHQHLTILAQAFLLTGRDEFFEEIVRQWKSWVAANPYQRGINFASALEVAFRALSWIWVYHLAGSRMEPAFRSAFLTELHRHGYHLEYNLSFFFSPNTHLLGEAVALHAIGALFPSVPRAGRWRQLGGDTVREQLARQVRDDGSHFEQSTYYHVYALDFFLLHFILAGQPAGFGAVLQSMAAYLDAVMGPQRRIPLIGDDDGGRLFYPRGIGDRYARATLATCAILFDRPDWIPEPSDAGEQAVWWLGDVPTPSSPRKPSESRVFAASGSVIMAAGDFWMLVNAGGFGPFRAGHSHSHVLALVARYRDEDILIDPGTYTYMSDPEWRNWFRGSSAHNTVRVNGLDQATPAGPFAWNGKPEVKLESWRSNAEEDQLVASCHYDGITHRRHIVFLKPHAFFILDEVHGSSVVEQFWHAGETTASLSPSAFRIGERVILATSSEARLIVGERPGWRSRAYGQKEPAPAIRVSVQSQPPVFLGAVLYAGDPASILMSKEAGRIGLAISGTRLAAQFELTAP